MCMSDQAGSGADPARDEGCFLTEPEQRITARAKRTGIEHLRAPHELHARRLMHMSAQADGGLTLFNEFPHGPRTDMLAAARSVADGIFRRVVRNKYEPL